MNSEFDALLTQRFGQWRRPKVPTNSFTGSLKFVAAKEKSGKSFNYPVLTAYDMGITADATGGIATLNPARAGYNQLATLDGVNLYIRSQLSYSDLMKMGNGSSPDGQAASYADGPEYKFFSMRKGLEIASELMSLYGCGTSATIGAGGDVGVIATVPVISGGPNWNQNPVVNITHGSFAQGIWRVVGSGGNANGGILVDIYQSDRATLRANNIQCIGAVDFAKCAVKFNATAATSTGAGVAVAAGDIIVPAGWKASSALGVSGICRVNGSFAGIDNTSTPEWKVNSLDLANTALTFDVLQNFCARMANVGNEDMRWDVWVNPNVVAGLHNSGIQSLTRFNDAGAEKKTVGTRSFEVVSQAGRLRIRPYPFIKQGEVLVVNPDEAVRVGAEEERTNGLNGAGLVMEIADKTGSELRAMAQFAPLLTLPITSGIITGVKSASDSISTGDLT